MRRRDEKLGKEGQEIIGRKVNGKGLDLCSDWCQLDITCPFSFSISCFLTGISTPPNYQVHVILRCLCSGWLRPGSASADVCSSLLTHLTRHRQLLTRARKGPLSQPGIPNMLPLFIYNHADRHGGSCFRRPVKGFLGQYAILAPILPKLAGARFLGVRILNF